MKKSDLYTRRDENLCPKISFLREKGTRLLESTPTFAEILSLTKRYFPSNTSCSPEQPPFTRRATRTIAHMSDPGRRRIYASRASARCPLASYKLPMSTTFMRADLSRAADMLLPGKPTHALYRKELQECAEELHGPCEDVVKHFELSAILTRDHASPNGIDPLILLLFRLPNALGGCGILKRSGSTINIELKKSKQVYYGGSLHVPSCKLDIEVWTAKRDHT